MIKKELKIDINKYCDQKKQNGTIVRKWSVKKLNGSEIGNTLNSYYSSKGRRFDAKDVYSDNLRIIIEAMSGNKHLIYLVNEIRKVEQNIRNLAAHEIISITDRTNHY